jgi:TolB-like protein/Tfp pilus assembly protein PilF
VHDERSGCISMEYIDGDTLSKLRCDKERKVFEPPELSDWMSQLCDALDYAHNYARIIHRDLKPANLMVNQRGQLKVSDFGIARSVGDSMSVLTMAGGRSGTLAYMSPQQLEGERGTHLDDIYSLSASVYELLTSKPPFYVGNIDRQIREKIPPSMTERRKEFEIEAEPIPAVWEQCVAVCLAKDPARRPQSALEVAQRLQLAPTQAGVVGLVSGKRTNKVLLVGAGIGALLLLTLGGWYLTRQSSKPIAAAAKTAPTSIAPTVPEKSIAVLPFKNLSEEKANAYFAEGVQNEILTRLTTVRDLKVISRTSTAKYQSKPDNLKTVAQELGVSTILEGAVQKAGDKVRVNVQLIDARADTHLWAKSYDRDFKDVLGVESEVSQEIAEALQANLSPSESHALAAVGTRDAEAYDLFLRGEYELHQAESSLNASAAYDRADAFYRQALARDPNFAEAAAELARSRLSRHWFVSPLAPAEFEEIKSIIDHALALAPNSPEAHLALGVFFYRGHRQYENALTEFNRTLELQPNNALARLYCAAVYRRRGEWERSLADFQRAQELDPRDAQIPQNIGVTYQALRQWKDAERAELRALAIDPHNAVAALTLLSSRLDATGNVDSARRALDDFRDVTKGIVAPPTSFNAGFTTGGGVGAIIGIHYLHVIERRFTDAFQAFEKEVGNDDLGHLRRLAGRVALRVLAGQPEAAKSTGEEALPLLEARLRERPDDTPAMTWLSWVYLALGRNADALRLSGQAADSISIEKDAMDGPGFQNGLAQIEARAGAPEEAIKRLRRLLSIPAGTDVSIALLKIDPVWDPIRNRPDFQQLLSGPEQIGPVTQVGRTAAVSAQPATIPEKSIAVLPFENLSRDPDNAYFADGIQEEILTRLAKIADLKVVSRTSTVRYKRSSDNLPQIAKQLGVANVLEGGVQRTADEVRVNVQLIKAENDAHLWADTFDRKLTDIFAVESEIAQTVAETLRAKLSGSEQHAIAARPTENTEAYQLYLKGRFFWNKRTGQNLNKAADYFNQAIAADPKYALAYVGLADAYVLMPFYGAGAPRDCYPKAKAAARKALELDDALAEAHTSLALVLCLFEFDFSQANREFQHAIELNPNYATAHQWYGNEPLVMLGRFDESIAEAKRALELDPLSLIINADLGNNYFFARRYDEAIEQLRKTLEMDPSFYYARWNLGQALETKGALDAAIKEYEKARALDDDPSVLGLLAHAYASSGNKTEALKILDQLKELSRQRYVRPYSFAIVYLGLGDKEEALRWLEKSYQDRGYDICTIKVDPFLDPLRGDPRFEALVAKVLAPKNGSSP